MQSADALWSWLADNLMRGVAEAHLSEELALQGIAPTEAGQLIAAVRAHPLFPVGKAFATEARRSGSVARLHREQSRAVLRPIARIPDLEPETFLANHYAANWPVVITELGKRWSALNWNLDTLKERFGDEEVEITRGREGDPDFDRNHDTHCARIRFGEYVEMVRSAGATNDFYMVARNRAFGNGLAALLRDMELDERVFDTARLETEAALWFGPKGTVTPLHHDTSNILLCQVLGQKRVFLVSPSELALFDCARGLYANLDPEDEAQVKTRGVQCHVIDLSPGEALFIPVGWWHHVRSLEISITLAVNSFRAKNRFDWYQPGAL